MTYTIGEAAAAAGVTSRAVRLYEARGLLRSVDRSPAGYRLFDQRHIEALSFIRDARDLGLTLEEITAITALADERGTPPCDLARALLDRRVAKIDESIDELLRLRSSIIQACGRGPRASACLCPVIEREASSAAA